MSVFWSVPVAGSVKTVDTWGLAAPEGVAQFRCSARPDTPDVIVVISNGAADVQVKVTARLEESVTEVIPYVPEPSDWVKVYTVSFLSVSVNPPVTERSIANRPAGAEYEPSEFFPKPTTDPSGYVTFTEPDSTVTRASKMLDQDAPNAPAVRGSSEL